MPAPLLGVIWSFLSVFAATYLVSAIGQPSFFLRVLSVGQLAEGKAARWRVWLQGAFTVICMSFLVYAASYALVAGIPYDWGDHDEDGEWFALRDNLRFLLTVVGAFYFTFALDDGAKASLRVQIERAVRAELLNGFSDSYDAAMKTVRFQLNLDRLLQPYWAIAHQEEYARWIMHEYSHADRIKRLRNK